MLHPAGMTALDSPTSTLQAHVARCAVIADRVATLVGSDPSVAMSAARLHEGGPLPPYQAEAATDWLHWAAESARRADPRPEVAEAVRLHRERADGSGPFGLTRRRIPVAAAIVGLVHCFDVIVDGRPEYRAAALELLSGHARYPTRLLEALAHVESSL